MNDGALLFLMLLAGMGIPIMAAQNASMGQHLNSPIAAVIILSTVALVGSLVLLILQPHSADFGKIMDAPKWGFVAGLFFLFYIASITYSAPKIGLGNAVVMVLIGQVICAALIDHFGLFGAAHLPITLPRIAGFGLLAAGFWLVIAK